MTIEEMKNINIRAVNPEKSGHLLVNEEVKPVVVRIFEERTSGKSIEKITAGLNRDGISCPDRYRYEKGNMIFERFKDSLWYSSVVRGMLQSHVYMTYIKLFK